MTPLVAGRARLSSVDAGLPTLADAFDPARAAALFAATWQAEVTGCTLLTTCFEPGVRCRTTHAVQLDGGSTVGVLESDRLGISARRFDHDPDLPGLAPAVDGEQLSTLLGPGPWTVEPVSYRPGQRAVLRYRNRTGTTLYGKVLGRGGAELGATLTALHEASRIDPALPLVPGPVLMAGDLVVQPEVPGPSLHRIVFGGTEPPGEARDAVRATGMALARLHAATVVPPCVVAALDDVVELRDYLPAAACADQDVAGRLAAAIEIAAVRGPAGPPVTSHGALRTDQVIVHDARPALIDLDGCCAAHAGRDVGNVLAYLRWRAIRRPDESAVVEVARGALLDGYRAHGVVDAEALRFYEAVALLKIAGRRFRRLAVDEWPLVPALVDDAEALLEATR